MARIKAVYGKRPKTNNSFATSTNFNWSSPNKPSAEKQTQTAIEDATSGIASLGFHKGSNRTKISEKNQDRALRTIDGNVTPKPARRKERKDGKGDIIEVEEGKHQPVYSQPSQNDKKTALAREPREEKTTGRQSENKLELTPTRRHRRRKAHKISHMDQEVRQDSQDEETSSTALATAPTRQPCPEPTQETPSSKPQHRRVAPSSVAPSPVSSNPTITYTKPLLRLCNDAAGRTAPTPFSTWSTSLEPYFNILKIAEASYGEVYRLSLKSPHPNFSTSDESVLKIIALRPAPGTVPRAKKGRKKTKAQKAREEMIEGMSAVESVESEVRLLQRMTHVPGFTNFREVRVLQGVPTEPFVEAWRVWNEGREEDKRSIFPDPGEMGSYDEEQLWAVIEMQDAGTDLENLKVEDIGGVFGIWDVFWGVALALGKGEEEARFEHRDLHMGNICIRPSNPSKGIQPPSSTHLSRNLNFTGLETTIIDYTLSRAQLCDPSSPSFLDPSESQIAYLDLEADPAIFDGDADEEYQYEVYRMMRASMYLDDPLADIYERWDEATETGRTWRGYHPQTNLVWLHFVLHELMRQVEPPVLEKKKKKKKKGGRSRSRRRVVDVDEDEDEDEKGGDELFEKKRAKLEKKLGKVQKLLDPKNMPKSGLHSVKDLVALALEEAWLEEEDVIAVPTEDGERSLLDMVSALDISSSASVEPERPKKGWSRRKKVAA